MRDLEIDNLTKISFGQLIKDNDLVKPVNELRCKCLSYLRHYLFFQLFTRRITTRLESKIASFLDSTCTDVGSHYKNGVFTIDRLTLRVRKNAVFEYL